MTISHNSLSSVVLSIELCNHYHSLSLEHFISPEEIPHPLQSLYKPQLMPRPRPYTSLCHVSMDLPVLDTSCQWNHTTCGVLWWLLSLNTMLSRFIHVTVYISISFPFIAKSYSIVWMNQLLFIHWSVDEYMHHLCFLAIRNSVAMNICVRFHEDVCFNFFEYKPKSEIKASKCNSVEYNPKSEIKGSRCNSVSWRCIFWFFWI